MDIADAKQGMATGNNDKFVRCWFEVDYDKIGFNRKNIENTCQMVLPEYRL